MYTFIIRFFCALGLVAITQSCNDSDKKPEPIYPYTSTCTINDVPWEGVMAAANTQDSLLSMTATRQITSHGLTYSGDGWLIYYFPKKIGKNNIYRIDIPYSHYYVPQAGGDVGCDTYVILASDSLNNWIELTEEENDYEFIKGKYSMTLIRVETCDASVMPDTVRIRNGEFYVKVEY